MNNAVVSGRLRLVAVGTRGDVDPYLNLARELSRRGHRVVLHVPADHVARVQAHEPGLEVSEVPSCRLFPAGRWLSTLVFAHAGISYLYLRHRYRRWSHQASAAVLATADPDDVLICGLATSALAQKWWQAGRRSILLALADPTMPSLRHLPLPVPVVARRVVARLLWRLTLQLSSSPVVSSGRGRRQLSPLPVVFAVSTVLFPESSGLPAHAVRTGHLIGLPNRHPDGEVSGAPPPAPRRRRLHLGFGSVAGAESYGPWQRAAHDLGIDVVVDAPGVDADHPALFASVDAVVHHGGAGTTITGLLAGKPTLITPLIGDQFAIARAVHSLGLGPRHRPTWAWTTRARRQALADLINPTAGRQARLADVARRLVDEGALSTTADACERAQ